MPEIPPSDLLTDFPDPQHLGSPRIQGSTGDQAGVHGGLGRHCQNTISARPHFPGAVKSMCKRTFSMFVARQPWPSLAQASEETNPRLQGRRLASGSLLFERQSPRIVLWATLAAGSSSRWHGPSFSLPQNFKAFTAFFSTLFLRASLPYSFLWLVLSSHNKARSKYFSLQLNPPSVTEGLGCLHTFCHLRSQGEPLRRPPFCFQILKNH